eukprot:CFRG1565T1
MKNMVMNYSEIEIKVRECTNLDSWGPTGTQMAEVSKMTYNYQEFKEVMEAIWKRTQETHWRHVYKSLLLLDYLIKNGSDKVISNARDKTYDLRAMENFRYTDEQGKDQGINVRQKAKDLRGLLQDDDRIREERSKARSNRGKFTGVSASEVRGGGGSFRGFSATGGFSSSDHSSGSWGRDGRGFSSTGGFSSSDYNSGLGGGSKYNDVFDNSPRNSGGHGDRDRYGSFSSGSRDRTDRSDRYASSSRDRDSGRDRTDRSRDHSDRYSGGRDRNNEHDRGREDRRDRYDDGWKRDDERDRNSGRDRESRDDRRRSPSPDRRRYPSNRDRSLTPPRRSPEDSPPRSRNADVKGSGRRVATSSSSRVKTTSKPSRLVSLGKADSYGDDRESKRDHGGSPTGSESTRRPHDHGSKGKEDSIIDSFANDFGDMSFNAAPVAPDDDFGDFSGFAPIAASPATVADSQPNFEGVGNSGDFGDFASFGAPVPNPVRTEAAAGFATFGGIPQQSMSVMTMPQTNVATMNMNLGGMGTMPASTGMNQMPTATMGDMGIGMGTMGMPMGKTGGMPTHQQQMFPQQPQMGGMNFSGPIPGQYGGMAMKPSAATGNAQSAKNANIWGGTGSSLVNLDAGALGAPAKKPEPQLTLGSMQQDNIPSGAKPVRQGYGQAGSTSGYGQKPQQGGSQRQYSNNHTLI